MLSQQAIYPPQGALPEPQLLRNQHQLVLQLVRRVLLIMSQRNLLNNNKLSQDNLKKKKSIWKRSNS